MTNPPAGESGAEPKKPAVNADQLEIVKVAFGEAVRKLGVVHDAADSIRSRAGTVLAAATAVGGFVGGLAIGRSPQGPEWALAALGLACYLWSTGLSLQVLAPDIDAWAVGQNTATLARVAATESATRVYGRLAIRYQESFDITNRHVGNMAKSLRRAVWLMVAELFFLACLLAVTVTHSPPSPTLPTPLPAPTSTSTTSPPATSPP